MMLRLTLFKILVAPLLASLLLLITGCLPGLPHREVQDLAQLPQQAQAYLDPASAAIPLMAPGQQQAAAAEFLENHFLAWHAAAPLAATRSPFWAVDWLVGHQAFGENLRPLESGRRAELIDQANPEAYPSLNRRAITLRRADLRALPTHGPLFNDPGRAGEGFPFDTLQHAAIPANTPVLASHRSRDQAWVFVETALTYGWLPATELAWVDDEFVRAFESGRYVVLVHDDVAVIDTDGIYRFSAGIGTLLPVGGTETDGHRVLLALADPDRQALLREATISLDHGERFPLPLTPRRLAGLADRMVGQAYAWGERFAGRDCSATVRDLFAPFGLWLPRNSAQQARVGQVIPLADLTPRQREARLLAEGRPFLTLVRLPGHIMLYIGRHEERAVLLHTLWGLRTRTILGREGRWLVGKTVLTTLEPGLEKDSLLVSIGSLLQRVESMNVLVPVAD